MNAYVRDKVAAALESDGIEEIIKLGDEENKEQDIFDLDYLANIDKIKLPNTKIQLLQKLLAKAHWRNEERLIRFKELNSQRKCKPWLIAIMSEKTMSIREKNLKPLQQN